MEVSRIGKDSPAQLFLAVLLFIILPATAFAQSTEALTDKPWKFIVTCDSRGLDNGISRTIFS